MNQISIATGGNGVSEIVVFASNGEYRTVGTRGTSDVISKVKFTKLRPFVGFSGFE